MNRDAIAARIEQATPGSAVEVPAGYAYHPRPIAAPSAAAGTNARSYFAKHVHAEAHAVVALQGVRKLLDRSTSRDALYRHIDDEIIRRCQRCGLEPDLLGDAIEAAAEEAAIAAGGEE